MVKALSLDLRVRVLAAVTGGMSHRELAQVFAVSPVSVSRWRKPSHETSEPRTKGAGGDNRSHYVEAYIDLLVVAIDANIEDLLAVEMPILCQMDRRPITRNAPNFCDAP